jgi:hypothetical protein
MQHAAVRRRAGRGGDQLVVAVEQVGYAALADRHAAPVELAVDLRHTAVLAVAQIADQRDHIQPELMLRQRQGALGLRSPRLVVAPAARSAGSSGADTPGRAATHSPGGWCSGSASRPAFRAGLLHRDQDLLVRRLHPAPTPRHLQTLGQLRLTASTGNRFCRSSFFFVDDWRVSESVSMVREISRPYEI